MKRKLFKKTALLLLAITMAFPFVACGKDKAQSVSNETAYAQLKAALTTTVVSNQIDISIQGKLTNITVDATGDTPVTTEEKGIIDIVMQLQTDENNKTVAQNTWIKLLDDKNEGLILEQYYKDGNLYTYSNFIKESYGYEENAEGGEVDLSDVDATELAASIDRISSIIPNPKATVIGEKYSIEWTVNNDNLKRYVEAYCRIDAPEATDEEIAAKVQELTAQIKLNKPFKLGIVIENGILSSAKLEFDVTYGLNTYRGNVTFSMSLKDVTMKFPETRLAEIKAAWEAEQTPEEPTDKQAA